MALEKQQLAQLQSKGQREQDEYMAQQKAEKIAGLAAIGMSKSPQPGQQPPQQQGGPPAPGGPMAPQPQPPGGQGGGAQPPPPPGAVPPPGAGAPQPAGGGSAGGAPPQNLFGEPDTPYGYSFRAIVSGIKKTNPDADEVTVLKAADRLQQLMAPDAKATLAEQKNDLVGRALQARMDQFEQKERDVAERLRQGEDRVKQGEGRLAIQQAEQDRKREISDLRAEMLRAELAGADPREIQKHRNRLDEIEKRQDGDGLKAENNVAKADVKDAEADAAAIEKKISGIKANNGGFMPGPSSKDWPALQKLLKERQDASDKLLKARKAANDLLRKTKVHRAKEDASPSPEPGGTDPAATPDPSPSPATDDGAPKKGDVVDGHRFKGGDPSKQENWEPVK